MEDRKSLGPDKKIEDDLCIDFSQIAIQADQRVQEINSK